MLCPEVNTHAYRNVPSLREFVDSTVLLSVCTHTHASNIHGKEMQVGDDEDAVTGVPHLLSCERVPELALG